MESAVAPVVVRKPRRLMVEIMFVLPCGRSEPAPTIRSMIGKVVLPIKPLQRRTSGWRFVTLRGGAGGGVGDEIEVAAALRARHVSRARAALTQPYASIDQLGARGPDDLGPERSLRRHSGGELRGRGAHR